jgi:hypothetical protein
VTFRDPDASASSSDFSVAAINWGDGSTSTADLTITGRGGSYTVTGSHVYAQTGVHQFSLVVKDAGGGTATITGSMTVVSATPFNVVQDLYVIGSGTASVSATNGVLANDTGPSLTVVSGTATGVNVIC